MLWGIFTALMFFVKLSKTQAVRNVLDWAAPKIYGSSVESDPKSYNAVIVEDVRPAATKKNFFFRAHNI